MDQSVFPWWLVLLVGLWTAGLTCWLSERCSASLRNYAGLCCLAYTVMLWFVLSAGTTGQVDATEPAGRLFALRVFAGLSLAAALGLIGPSSPVPRTVSLIVFGLSTGGVCLCLGKPVIAGVCLAAIGCAFRFRETTHAAGDQPPVRTADVWLIGVACGVFALGLLGALRWTMRVEFAQPATSHHLPHKPPALDESHGTRFAGNDWLQRHPEFPWLAAGLLVTSLAWWDVQRSTGMEPSSTGLDRTP